MCITIMDGRVHVSNVLPHAEIHPLDEDLDAVDAFILMKTIDRLGMVSWAYRHTADKPNREELLGALQIQVDLLRKELLEEWD